jgi:hypothetical protein
MGPDGLIELHDTKGHMEDDAATKIRVCSERFPFAVYVVRWQGGEWVKKRW